MGEQEVKTLDLAKCIYEVALKEGRLEPWYDLYQTLRRLEVDKIPLAREMVLKLKDIAPILAQEGRTAQEVQQGYEIYRGALFLSAKWNVDSYFLYVEIDREPKEQFYLPRRAKIQPIIQGFQDLLDDNLDILTISCPPGIGKTTAGLRFMSMILGLRPYDQCVATGHSTVLVKNFYDGVKEIMASPEYNFRDIFPDAKIAKASALDCTLEVGREARLKSLTCRSISGEGLTGVARCNNLLYCDDLVSGIEEAKSKPRLDSLWEKYANDARTRKKEECKELHIATRWSVHDVIGRLEREFEGSDRFRSVVMDCYDENGESQFDFDYGVGFTTEYFQEMEKVMDDVSFRALFRNQPIEREGLVYDSSELRYFHTLPKDPEKVAAGLEDSTMAPDAIISVVDPKDRGKDYYFSPIVYVYGSDYYIVDCMCDDGVSGLEARLGNLYMKHGVQKAQVEANHIGSKSAEILDAYIQRNGGFTHITRRTQATNKETRILVWSDWVKRHCLFLTSDRYVKNSDYGRMMIFLTSYSQKGKNPFDDVPDGMAQLAQYAQSFTRPQVKAVVNPFW